MRGVQVIARASIRVPFPQGNGITIIPGAYNSILRVEAVCDSWEEARALLASDLRLLADAVSEAAG